MLTIMSQRFKSGGGAMFALAAIFGDVGCSLGSFITGIVASMPVWGSFGLKAGLLVNIIYPVIFAVTFRRLNKIS